MASLKRGKQTPFGRDSGKPAIKCGKNRAVHFGARFAHAEVLQ